MPVQGWPAPRAAPLRLTVFDVGQGDATLLRMPGGTTILVDSAGTPFGSGGFDIGERVLAPALWALGVRSLEQLVLTHGHPDHIGGASSVINDFAPRLVWEGVPVAAEDDLERVLRRAREHGAAVGQWQAGHVERIDGVRVRVLHPAPPDWHRPRVRNDDSVVLELTIGDVAIVLPGDVGADVERAISGELTPAPIRILKLAHHGSQTSSARELFDVWKPQVAVVSAGRGNSFGHPSDEVLRRVDEYGVGLYRTDQDGQITIETDGSTLQVTTFRGDRR